MVIKDENLKTLFENHVDQFNNSNANAEIFIYNGKILKVYMSDDNKTRYNLKVIDKLINNKEALANIEELVLPIETITYNDIPVGFVMPFIKGYTLYDLVDNYLVSEDRIRKIFIKILKAIDKFKNLPFPFYIGDLHEKNIIIDNDMNVHLIDCDSYVIDNDRYFDNNECLVGKYINNYFDNDKLKEKNNNTDYLSLLCIILSYAFKDSIENTSNPIECIKHDERFKKLYYLIDKVENSKQFVLNENDIEKIFDFKRNFKDIGIKENQELKKQIERIRKIGS